MTHNKVIEHYFHNRPLFYTKPVSVACLCFSAADGGRHPNDSPMDFASASVFVWGWSTLQQIAYIWIGEAPDICKVGGTSFSCIALQLHEVCHNLAMIHLRGTAIVRVFQCKVLVWSTWEGRPLYVFQCMLLKCCYWSTWEYVLIRPEEWPLCSVYVLQILWRQWCAHALRLRQTQSLAEGLLLYSVCARTASLTDAVINVRGFCCTVCAHALRLRQTQSIAWGASVVQCVRKHCVFDRHSN